MKLNNQKFLSDKVFGLSDEQKSILKYIAIQENPEKDATITKIARFLNEENPLEWHVMKKRLEGTRDIDGLISYNLISSTKVGKDRKYVFKLTFKGFLASLSTGAPLNKITIYKNYIKYLSNFIDDNRILKLIEKHIKDEIHVFLLLHYLRGIILKESIDTPSYFEDFFSGTLRLFYQGYKAKNEEELRRVKEIINSYEATLAILSQFGLNTLNAFFGKFVVLPGEKESEPWVLDDPDYVSEPQLIEPKKIKLTPLKKSIIKKNRSGLALFTIRWSLFFEKIYHEKSLSLKINQEYQSLIKKTQNPWPTEIKFEIENQIKRFSLKDELET